MNKNILSTLLIATILITPAIMQTSCGEDPGDIATQISKAVSAEDRAARLAAQSNLRNAQMAQEAYYAENERYASSASELKTMDQRLNSKVQVISGSSGGYEMSIEASDSQHTIYIIRRSGSKVEHVDESGNSW